MHVQPGLSLDPYVTYSQQTAPGGTWSFPPAGEVDFVLLKGGVVYLNITASDCQAANPVPNGRILRTHHYYPKRPYATFMYGEFDKLKWSAYIGMGNETVGTALAGETGIQSIWKTQSVAALHYCWLMCCNLFSPWNDLIYAASLAIYIQITASIRKP